jgi:hypothetical protein
LFSPGNLGAELTAPTVLIVCVRCEGATAPDGTTAADEGDTGPMPLWCFVTPIAIVRLVGDADSTLT